MERSPSSYETQQMREAKELRGHLAWLETFTPLALAVLAVASGIYTYLGVTGLLERTGLLSFFAAVAYSTAVSVGIFVFWSYVLRLLPSMTRTSGRVGLSLATALGCAAIIAMSSWLNAAALAGSAAVEQHLARTVQEYQSALEMSHENVVAAQALQREIARARATFQDLSEQEKGGNLSGFAGRGAVYKLLVQKADELAALEAQIAEQEPKVSELFERGNTILSRMRALIAEPGSVEIRSVSFAEQSVRLAGLISDLRQRSAAGLVHRAAEDLQAVVLPELVNDDEGVREAQSATIRSVLDALTQRAGTLSSAAQQVLDRPAPAEIAYTPLSTAAAVIEYAGEFVPSWAGAIAIDLLPLVLVFILVVTQASIRDSQANFSLEQTMTLADLEVALQAVQKIERSFGVADAELASRSGTLWRRNRGPEQSQAGAG